MDTDYERRKQLLKDIEMLSRPEQEELYRILRRDGAEISENSNGIFFDVAALPAAIFDTLWTFIQFCKSNAKDLEQRNKVIHDMTTS